MQRPSNPKLILQSLFRGGHRTLGAWMTLIILTESMGLALPQPSVWAQTYPAGNAAYTSGGAGFQTMTTSPRPVRAQVKIMQDVNMATNNARVTLKMREAPIRDVLNLIARQGHFNIVVDKSVEGTISVDLTDVSINKALEYIFTASDLNYTKDGNTMIAFSQTASKEHSLNAKTFKAIPVRYKSAPVLAQQLNNTLLGVPRPGGSQAGVVSDADSNTILVVGTDIDIRLVEKALHELDIPRNRKVYQIRHAQPSYVAQVIAANFFGSSSAAGGGGAAGAGGGGAAGGGAAAGGGGGATGGGAAAGGGGTAGGGAAAGGGGGATGGGAGNDMVLNAGGVTFISEPISATLTVLGTDEQIAQVDSLIDQVDVRRPQVSIEVSLVEIQRQRDKVFQPTWGTMNFGQFRLGLLSSNLTNTLSYDVDNASKLLPTVPSFTLTNSDSTSLGKILANPTIVAMDGTQSNINITDEVATILQTTTTSIPPVISTEIKKEQAGVTMEITPTVFNDGTVQLNLKPTVKQPIRELRVGGSSTFLLSERSVEIAGVRVKDGQTLVIGGLLRETTTEDLTKVPGLGDLPILGAMFRNANTSRKTRTELVLMVTPHILRENAVPYFANPALSSMNAGVPGNLNDGNIKPIGLPRYMGEYSAVANQAIAEPELPSVSPSSRSPLRQLFGGRPKSPPTMAPMTAPPPRQRIQPETIKPIESP